MRKKQEDKCGERKWEIEMRKKKKKKKIRRRRRRHAWVREKY